MATLTLKRAVWPLIGVATLAGLGLVTHYLGSDDVLELRELRLVGEFKHVNADELKALVAARIDGNFLAVDVKGVHEVVTSLPWVSNAWVDRIWPDVLQVRVVEQKPIAVWNDSALLNADGRAFVAAQMADWPSVPAFTGPPSGEKLMAQSIVAFSAALAPAGLRVTAVGLDARHAWTVTLDNGIELMLGRERTQERLERFVKIYPARLQVAASQVQRVDLRYTNGFAVKWRGGIKVPPGFIPKATV